MSIITNAKELADLIKKLGDVDLYRKILDLEEEIIELTTENRSLKEQVQKLEEIKNIEEKMSFKRPFWFMDGDETPYCPKCWEGEKKNIHLIELFSGRWKCPVCDTLIDLENRRGVKSIPLSRR
jgi:hypothetical protein